jgi:hypothetical protein
MTSWHRSGRFAVTASILVLFGLSFDWQRLADSGPPTSFAGESAAQKDGKTPKQVQIIRHAEKPDDAMDIHLSSRGAGRAAALPSLFVIPPTFSTKPAPFATPDFLFATKESKNSNRPVETITPLSKALGDMPIHQKHADKDYQAVVDEIFGDTKYAKKVVLICWHHGKIPDLAKAVAHKAKNEDKLKKLIPDHWQGSVFDRVFVFTFDDSGSATFADSPQKLLFGDSKK